jgi:hypothetical protein
MTCPYSPHSVIIPDPEEGEEPECGIKPGIYLVNDIVQLLREHADNPDIIRYLADMMEE